MSNSNRDTWAEQVIQDDYVDRHLGGYPRLEASLMAKKLTVIDDVMFNAGEPFEMPAARVAWWICVRRWRQRQRDGFKQGELAL